MGRGRVKNRRERDEKRGRLHEKEEKKGGNNRLRKQSG